MPRNGHQEGNHIHFTGRVSIPVAMRPKTSPNITRTLLIHITDRHCILDAGLIQDGTINDVSMKVLSDRGDTTHRGLWVMAR